MNPYLILGAGLFYLASLVGAGYAGWDYRDAKVAQEVREKTDDALSQARKQAADDLAAATKRVAQEAAAQERARFARRAATADALASATPDCVRSDASVRLLNLAVAAANSAAEPAGSLPYGVPGITATGGRVGLERKAVGAGSD